MSKILKLILNIVWPRQFIWHRIKNSKKAIALTFDDGPHAVNTPRILKILAQHNCQATFFVTGDLAKKNTDILKTIVRSGHELGNHGFIHLRSSQTGLAAYKRGIKETAKLLEVCSGARSRLFRPPFGEITPGIVSLIAQDKMICAGWTIDSWDSYIKEKDKLVESIKKTPIASGDILLFHDDYPSTVEALPEILSDLYQRGFVFITFTQLLKVKS
jgi:peptidoglycan/xylan/chitin deacetylase (PgdA/CDA1 family)